MPAEAVQRLLSAFDEFEEAVKGDRRYSRLVEQLHEIRTDLGRAPDPRDEGESPGQRVAREAGATDNKERQGPPSFLRKRGRATAPGGNH